MLMSTSEAETDPAIVAETEYERFIATPAMLVFGDDLERRCRLAALAARAGARIVGAEAIADAPARLDMQAAGHVLVDLVADDGPTLDRLLDRLEGQDSPAAIVVADRMLIDIVARRPRLASALLVEPEEDEIAEAIVERLQPRPAVVRDGAVEANGRRLQDLRDELGRIARSLANLSGSIEATPVPSIVRDGADLRASAARAEIRRRRLRGQFFEPALFADPAWDMLLDLAASGNERRRVAVSSLCIAAAVPPTTALRWIAQMTDHGLLVREPDPDDRRRVFIALSVPARTAMDRYLDAVVAAGGDPDAR